MVTGAIAQPGDLLILLDFTSNFKIRGETGVRTVKAIGGTMIAQDAETSQIFGARR